MPTVATEMSEIHAEDALGPSLTYHRAFAEQAPDEPPELTRYRSAPGDERQFIELRQAFRKAENWPALARLFAVRATHLGARAETVEKAAHQWVQASEVLLERLAEPQAAAAALIRAVELKPDDKRLRERLRKIYEAQGVTGDLTTLLAWELRHVESPGEKATIHLHLADLLARRYEAVAEAAEHYEQALVHDPALTEANELLGSLYLQSGAWDKARATFLRELEHLDPQRHRERIGLLYRRLARLEFEQFGNIPKAARDLQSALRCVPDDIEALELFGQLYIASGKTTGQGTDKAADIFLKTAEICRRRGEHAKSLQFLRRCLALAPYHQRASAALESALIEREDWLTLDELYREWLFHLSGVDSVPLLLRRADLLDRRLFRRIEARQLYEEASRFQRPDEESWRRLEQIYQESGDYYALAALLDAQAEQMPSTIPTETLLRAAQIYREELGLEERAAVYYYRVLEREPFNAVAFEGYKEHWRRKHNWQHLRDLILYQIEQAGSAPGDAINRGALAEEHVELAEICERRLGDIDGALAAWSRMAAAHPEDPRPEANIARIEKRARMWDNMVRVQEAELERTEDPAKRLDILKRLTQVYRDRQVNPARAIELYHEILQLSPHDVQATRALTALYDRTRDYPRVVEMMQEQYDRSRSNTERVSLLRRMAELWHHELDNPERAIWACEQILERAPADREALYRLQQILEEHQRYEELLTVLERELRQTSAPDSRIKLLRRMARIAEADLKDDARALTYWSDLAKLRPDSFEVTDRLIRAYEATSRFGELRRLLEQTISAPSTPPIRKIDLLLRLGQVAETHLEDVALATHCFEQVIELHPDHRGALEALVRLYRRVVQSTEAGRTTPHRPLVELLGRLQARAETEEEAFDIARERAELLANALHEPGEAAAVLTALPEGGLTARPEVAASLLEFYRLNGDHRHAIRQAELMALRASDRDEKKRLHAFIRDTWQRELGDLQAALEASRRFVRAFPDDADELWITSDLEVRSGDHEAALATLQRRLELVEERQEQTQTLERMAEIARDELDDPPRAFGFLRRALAGDRFNAQIIAAVRDFARDHGLWSDFLAVQEERFGYHGQVGETAKQVDLCLESADVAEEHLRDAMRAFEWTRRAYFIVLESSLPHESVWTRLTELAQRHGLWAELLATLEREVSLLDRRESLRPATYDPIARLMDAAEIAENQLDDPQRAVALLEQAHRRAPEHEEAAERLEEVASRHGAWQPVIDLYIGRLGRAVTELERFEHYVAIARICEDELDEPARAFEWLEEGWTNLHKADPQLGADLFERLLALADRRSLWPKLCAHYLARGRECLQHADRAGRLEAMRRAAKVFEEQLEDPFNAVRTLVHALDADPRGEELLPEFRRLGEAIDALRPVDAVPLGALILLEVQQRLCDREDATGVIALLRERAHIREHRLHHFDGAMAEWLRILALEPDHEEAISELERLAEVHDQWGLFLVLPAWKLQHTRDGVHKARRYRKLAALYEGVLNRTEYALRARLCAWRLEGELPPKEGPLGEEQATIWRLAEQTGAYRTPPVPKDPQLTPSVVAPEFRDHELWRHCGIDLAWLDEPPSPFEPRVDLTAEPLDPSPREVEELASAELVAPSAEDIALEIDDFELVELDDAEVEELVGDPEKVAPAAPAKPPRTPDAGLPPLPKLTAPVLPPRPRVASAWEEVALAYTETPTSNRQAQADVALVLARLWEEGAGHLERAFQAYERALVWVPEYEPALAGLRALAERHHASERLRQAYELLLSQAQNPEHQLALHLRIARLHTEREDWTEAERHFRGATHVDPRHEEALRALCDIYERHDRHREYAEVFAALLEAEDATLSEEELVRRTLELAELLSTKLGQKTEAIERLELLLRRLPLAVELHRELVRLLIDTRQWTRAIEAMRTAGEAVDDPELRAKYLATSAEIYEERLGLPERAITCLRELVDDVGDDDKILARLQSLYGSTGRYDEMLRIVERRLALVGGSTPEARERRRALLAAKARCLQEAPGNEEDALTTLEQLVREDARNDEAVLELSRLYRKMGRFEDGVAVLRDRWASTDPSDRLRYLALTVSLAEVLEAEAHDVQSALAIVDTALRHLPEQSKLLRARAQLARELQDPRILAEALMALPDPDARLEAADLLRGPAQSPSKAALIYEKLLDEAPSDELEPADVHRLMRAIEGIIRIKLDGGDIAGATKFVERQLEHTQRPELRAQLLTEMGRITYRSTSNVPRARSHFNAALQQDPTYARAKVGLGEVLMQAGELEEAETFLREAVEALALLAPGSDFVEALVALARVLEQTGRLGEAHRRLSAALKIAPDDFSIRAAIARNRHEAARPHEVLAVASALERHLSEGRKVQAHEAPDVAQVLLLTARVKASAGDDTAAAALYRRVLDFVPSDAQALAALVELHREHGEALEASRHAARLADGLEDRQQRAQWLLEAAVLGFEAASEGGPADVGDALVNLGKAVRIAGDLPEATLDPVTLERVFVAAQEHDCELALGTLDELLRTDSTSTSERHDLALEGARLALRAGDAPRAQRYAQQARTWQPASAAAVAVLAQVLEAQGRPETIEALARTYFEETANLEPGPAQRAGQVELLLHLARMTASTPEKAIDFYEQALALDDAALPVDDRMKLATLYHDVGRDTPAVERNLSALLEHDPLHAPTLHALAERARDHGELARAWAFYNVLALVSPSRKARAFLRKHKWTEGTTDTGTIEPLLPPGPPDAGIAAALELVWKQASSIFADWLGRPEVSPQVHISPLADSPLSKAWGDVLKRLGPSKVPLVAATELSSAPHEHCADVRPGAWVRVVCTYPGLLLVEPERLDERDDAALRFVLACALHQTRPPYNLALGLNPESFTALVSALLLAFHPRHSRRKHHQRPSELVARLSQDLARKVPMRAAREIADLLKAHEHESLDGPAWRAWQRRCVLRVGLGLGGDIQAALRTFGLERGSAVELGQQLEADPELRDLVIFSMSDAFLEGRRALGFDVVPA